MVKFKAIVYPAPSAGTRAQNKKGKLTVPDSSMSLKEILNRFVRNEAVPVGRNVTWHESDDDLDKIAHADLTEQAEFVEKQKETQRKYDREQKEATRKRREALKEEERAKMRAELEKEKKTETAPKAAV